MEMVGGAESVHLEVSVDVPHEREGSQERHGTQHEEEGVAAEESVAKELDSLQSPVHMRPLQVVEEGVYQDKQPRRPGDHTH